MLYVFDDDDDDEGGIEMSNYAFSCLTFSYFYTTLVHKVPRLTQYLGLGKCWTLPGKYVLNTGNFAARLWLRRRLQ
jgi:hypothetical protein